MMQTTSTLSMQCRLLFVVALSVLVAVEPTAIGLFPGTTNCGVTESKQNGLATFHRSFVVKRPRISERKLVATIKRRDKTMEDLQRVNETLWNVERAMKETKLAIIQERKWKYLMHQPGVQPLPKGLERFCKVVAEITLSLVSPEESLLRFLKKTRNELLRVKERKEAILKKSNELIESAQIGTARLDKMGRLVIVLPCSLPNDLSKTRASEGKK